MHTIIITGPSGSGKTYLSKKISSLLGNCIIISTDSYYKDDILIKLFSKVKYDLYDRIISIKKKEILKTIDSIYKRKKKILFYNYNFKNKISTKSFRNIEINNLSRFLIVEGIFAHRLDLNYRETINIVCSEEKNMCYQRRLMRDKLLRGRNSNEINKKFTRSWNLYHHNSRLYIKNNNIISVNQNDLISFNKLIELIKKIDM
tara:strand:+ start:619 stop:1227 length:609 start_codon:yes stop_codon:yes gene_type:complete